MAGQRESWSMPITMMTKEAYQRWKYDVVAALESASLMDVVDGTEVKPGTDKEKELKAWRQTDAKARRVLASGLNDEQHSAIRDCQSSHDIWSRIKVMMEKASTTNLYLVNQEFHRYTFDEEMTVAGYCSGLAIICQKMTTVGGKFEEENLVAKMINDLPDRFDQFRQSFRMQVAAGTKFTMTLVQEQLLMIEDDLQRKGGSTTKEASSSDAYYHKAGKPKVGDAQNKKKVKCYNCGKLGHVSRDCRQSKPTCFNCGQVGHISKNCKSKSTTKPGPGADSNVGFMARNGPEHKAVVDHHTASSELFVGDSGSSSHLVRDRQDFETYDVLSNVIHITIGDGSTLQAIGRGRVNVQVFNGVNWTSSHLDEVLHVPGMGMVNLFSFGAAADKGYSVQLTKDAVSLTNVDGRQVLTGFRSANEVYFVNVRVQRSTTYLAAGSLQLWHQRLGHIAPASVKRMAKSGIVNGLKLTGSDQQDFFCDGCAMGKMAKKPYKSVVHHSALPGERIHGDLCGPMEVASVGNSRYCFLLKDEGSGYRRTFYIKSKDQVLDKFKLFVAEQRDTRGDVMKCFRSDNGTEFVNRRFGQFLVEKAIVHETTAPYNPSQNGRAERELRTLQGLARAMLYAKSLPTNLWAEAMSTAAYAMNRSINTGLDQTPFELWTGQKPDVSHMKVFGSKAFAHVDKGQRKKWEPKAKELTFVGYSSTTKNVRLYDIVGPTVKEYRNVVLDPNSELIMRKGELFSGNDDVIDDGHDEPVESGPDEQHMFEHDETDDVRLADHDYVKKKPGRPLGATNKVYEKVDRDLRSKTLLLAREVPNTYDQALAADDSQEWLKAMQDEIGSLAKNKTWTLAKLPPTRQAIANRWLFKIKENADGSIGRYKARLVVKGFSQRHGVDYTETWAPVAKKQALLVALALAAKHDMDMVHFDVKTAFLHGNLDEDIYMVQPPGFTDGTDMVCRLHKALYGLKQAPRAWYDKLCQALRTFGLVRTTAEPCVFVEQEKDILTILVIYVDDGLLCSTSRDKMACLVNFLGKEFEMSVESPECVVGLQIKRNRGPRMIKVHQATYIRKVLERFRMTDCKSATSPADPSVKLKKTVDNAMVIDVPYSEAVGSLMYAMTCTRPDIAFAVGKVAQYMAKPSQEHWTAVKHVMRYLKGTVDLGIVFDGRLDQLHGYCDADYAGDLDGRKSTSGHVFLLSGGPVAWQSRLQKVQAMSTTEAEYIAAAEAAKEALWLRQLLRDLCQRPVGPTMIWCDNQGAIHLVDNPEITSRSKHIDVRHHFIRDRVADGQIVVDYVPTEQQAADMLTKALPGPGLKRCIEQLNLK